MPNFLSSHKVPLSNFAQQGFQRALLLCRVTARAKWGTPQNPRAGARYATPRRSPEGVVRRTESRPLARGRTRT